MACFVVAAVLTVAIRNSAAAPETTVTSAKREVEQMFAGASITITWVTEVEPGMFAIQVTLRRQPGGGPGAMAPSALGTTVGDDHHSGGSCFVFYERVLKFAHLHNRPAEAILAYAIAHEFGHVLLPPPAHASAGLMKAEWSDDDIRHLATDEQIFTADQVALMSAAIDGRGNAALAELSMTRVDQESALQTAPPVPPYHIFLAGTPGLMVRLAIDGARRRLAKPECQKLFTDFMDSSGHTLVQRLAAWGRGPEEALEALYFLEGDNTTQCRDNEMMDAFTETGNRVIYVCGKRFADLSTKRPMRELIVIHELLHALGLGENPPASADIGRRVMLRCGQR